MRRWQYKTATESSTRNNRLRRPSPGTGEGSGGGLPDGFWDTVYGRAFHRPGACKDILEFEEGERADHVFEEAGGPRR